MSQNTMSDDAAIYEAGLITGLAMRRSSEAWHGIADRASSAGMYPEYVRHLREVGELAARLKKTQPAAAPRGA